MSKTVHIESTSQFSSLISSSTIVVADFYADWCGPCKQIAPAYEQLSAQLSRPNKITFTKINVDKQQELAKAYSVTAMPTFMIFKKGRNVQVIRGADREKLSEVVKKLANEANAVGNSSTGTFGDVTSTDSMWLGALLPKGYGDVTDQVDLKGLELLNCNTSFGTVRALFEPGKPSAAEGKGKGSEAVKEWVQSDTDEQLMLYVPFQATLKIHSIHLTSLISTSEEEEDMLMRPRTVRIYTNRAQILGFDEAEDSPPTQEIVLSPKDWDPKTGTAKLQLRFVKFQNITSIVIFVVDGEGSGEETRLDRVRVIGETGEKRDPGKLEKVGEDE